MFYQLNPNQFINCQHPSSSSHAHVHSQFYYFLLQKKPPLKTKKQPLQQPKVSFKTFFFPKYGLYKMKATF